MNVTEMFDLTVASLGQFVEDEGDDVFEEHDRGGIRYMKIVTRAGVPLGAIAMGAPEGAVLLGRLRPFVRHRRALPDLPAFLAREDLDGRLAHRSAAKERTSCASLQ